MLPTPQDEHEEKALDDIARYGLHIVNVFGEGEQPGFTYSVGLWHSYRHAEVLIIGLKQQLSHWILNEIGRRVAADGDRFEPGGPYTGLIEGFGCVFRDVPRRHYPSTVTWDLWLYGGEAFPTVQCVWPTTDGYFPWDAEATDWFRGWQPVLAETETGGFS